MSGPVVVADPASAAAGGEEPRNVDVERTRARCAELLAELRPLLDAPSAAAEQTLREAVTELQGLGPEHACPDLIEGLLIVSQYHYLAAQPLLACSAAAGAVEHARRLDSPRLLRKALNIFGLSCVETGNLSDATASFSEALSVARRLGDPNVEAPVWNNLGLALMSSAQHADALRCFLKAEQLASKSSEPEIAQVQFKALSNIASCALHLRDVRTGIRAILRSIELNATPSSAAECLSRVIAESHYARLLLELGETSQAEERCRQARFFADKAPSARAEFAASMVSGLADVHASKYDIGLTRLKRSLEQTRQSVPSELRDALSACIAGYEAAGQPDAALVYLHELLALNREGRAARLLAPFAALGAEIGSDGSADRHLDQVMTGKALDLAGRVDKCVSDLVTASIDNALRAGHDATRIFRVGRLAQLFALSLGWTDAAAAELALAVRLMDVGSVVVPDELLRKPRGLSAGERKLVAEHTGYGADLLRQARLALLQPCVPVAKFHHERWDSAGPWGLAGEAIPVEARIAALADTLDALTHARPWRAAKSIQAALDNISAEAGQRFDPALSERFVAFVKAEFWRTHDWDAYLSAGAEDNSYVRARAQLDRLIADGGAT